jgi:hypothetical protein
MEPDRRFPDRAARPLFHDRSVVRVTAMRGTIHVTAAEDYPAMQRHFLPVQRRVLLGAFHRQQDGLDTKTVLSASRPLLTKKAITAAELGTRLQEKWPDRDRLALSMVGRMLLPLVHVPPAGLWRRGAGPKMILAKSWIDTAEAPDLAIDDLVLRYLAAFGPASVADAQAWCGLTRLDAVFERLRPQLVTFRSESGRELFDLPDAPRPDPDTPAPARLLAELDNVLLAFADRSRFLAAVPAAELPPATNRFFAVMLVDGRFAGFWRMEAKAKVPLVALLPRPSFGKRDRAALAAEAETLLGDLFPGEGGAVAFAAEG